MLSVIAFILVLRDAGAFGAAPDQAMEESGLDTATAQGVAAGDSDLQAGPGGRAERGDAGRLRRHHRRLPRDRGLSGNPAAVVTYTFTNNSDEATSPAVAVHAKAFQNGTEPSWLWSPMPRSPASR